MTLPKAQQEVLDKLLIEAVEKYDLTRMKIYVSKGANVQVNVNAREIIRMNGTYSSSGAAQLYHHMCTDYFREDVSDFMLAQGVDVDVKNFNGNTPLMLAVKNGNDSRVKYFLSKGADPLETNVRGEMVLDEARKLGSSCSTRQDIIDMLVAALESPVDKAQAAKKPAPEPETERDIQVLKPIVVTQRRNGGFNL
jgi:ankyrin repeat protein